MKNIFKVASKSPDEFGAVFFEEFLQGRTYQEFYAKYKSLHTILRLDTEWVFADFCFFNKIQDLLAESRSHVVLVVGNSHAEKVVQMLKVLNFQVIQEESLISQRADGATVIQGVFGAFTKNLLKATWDFLTPACRVCSKTENVKACSACKNVYYCSAECQKKAWPEHKVECKKNKGALNE